MAIHGASLLPHRLIKQHFTMYNVHHLALKASMYLKDGAGYP